MTENLLSVGTDVLIVDNDLRTITIPSSIKSLGVSSDDGVLRLKFQVPRYCGEFDLSEFKARINYLNAMKLGDVYKVTDMVVKDNMITFSWLVGRFATVMKGKVHFNVCLKKIIGSGEDAEVVKEFNTVVAILPVLEGLETTEQVIQQYPDLVETWQEELFGRFHGRIDDTLSIEGRAADAAVTGRMFSELVAEMREGYNTLDSAKANKTDITSPFNFKGTIGYSSLPTSGNKVNDTYFCTDKNCRYTWNGSSWYQSSMDETDYVDELSKVFKNRSTTVYDADQCTINGVYPISSSNAWVNLPDSYKYGGILMVFGQNTTTSCYQMFISYKNSGCYCRNRMKDVFNDWTPVLTPANLADYNNSVYYTIDESIDLNAITEWGYYFISSKATVENLPCDNSGGLLRFYYDKERNGENRGYQEYYDWSTGDCYYRHNKYGEFTEWKRFANTMDIEAVQKEYFVRKVDDEMIFIFKRGRRGYIRYDYRHHVNSDINLDTWRLGDIYLCDQNMTAVTRISSYGADNEGVLRINGEDDYVGGVHGDEHYTDFIMFVDGEERTIDTITEMYCDELRFVVASDIYHCNTSTVCMKKIKQTTFDKDGIHVNNRWSMLEAMTIYHVRAILLSVDKTCVTKYYDSIVNPYPMVVPESDGGVTDNRMIDTYYMGLISAHVWCGERGGDASEYAANISDFGDRLKSYFDCYRNHKTEIGEVLYCQNNFYITC